MFDLVFRVFEKLNIFNRIVELQGGKIEIDGHDISKIGLDVLRRRLALVPQDSTLFLGTLRENLYVSSSSHFLIQLNCILNSDPQRLRTDAELISVLQRAWLLPKDGFSDPAAEAKFSLDSTVGDEGLFSCSVCQYDDGLIGLKDLTSVLVKNNSSHSAVPWSRIVG